MIPVKPTPWKRPGLNKYTFYDTQAHERHSYRLHLEQQHGDNPPFLKSVQVNITFIFQIPKSIPKRKKIVLYHKTRPDIDNCVKLILDCFRPLIMKDDCLVSVIYAQKIYGADPRTEITITELE